MVSALVVRVAACAGDYALQEESAVQTGRARKPLTAVIELSSTSLVALAKSLHSCRVRIRVQARVCTVQPYGTKCSEPQIGHTKTVEAAGGEA